MPILLFILLLAPFQTLSASPGTGFGLKEKKIFISDVDYARYIRPQLKAIVSDYYSLLRELHPIFASVADLKLGLAQVSNDALYWDINCKTNSDDNCHQFLKQVHRNLVGLELLILKLKKTPYLFNEVDSMPLDVDALLMVDNYANQMYGSTIQLINWLEIMLLSYQTGHSKKISDQMINLKSTVHSLNINFDFITFQGTSGKFRDNFKFVYMNFIREIEQKILANDKKDLLQSNLETLNISWNTFHMKMTKSNLPTPNKTQNAIKNLHNRWNSILKVVIE